ncbi:titin isoform X7 [Strongylocentrotus purpuratus]|uniref:Cordon-bleu ubiquitin-like domain-containing protein n=1 Tax=Strongylocentrotus purpuratus TaxID=7668 RepID=A0A7M7N232_STRPU|nr:titin isoform X7 [Strongylocentrotus purpuratus]
MLKWAQSGGSKGNQSDNMKKMSFQISGKSKKSFKTSGIPAEPPSHTKAPSVNRAPPSNGSTTTHSNGAPPSPSNSFSSTSFSSTHSGGEAPRATGQRTLEITLPAGTTITSTVDAKLQMMDLLVMIAAKNKLNPTGHVILPATADRTDIAQFKASQRIGELDTTILQIVPKLSRGEIISIRTSDKKKAAQFEQTVRLTVLSGKNHKALFRVNPEKPIQDFLPQVYEERGIEANECRLRLVKTPEEDIDYSKSLNHYGGVNELVLIDLRPPPPQEPELVPIEKKKKSMFGRKSKKKGEGEPLSLTPTKEAAPPEPSQAPPAARQPSLDSTEGTDNNTLKKRRPAPPPPGGKKEPTHDEQLLKPSMEGVSRSAQGVSKKRRAPAPPPAGSAPPIPLVDPIPEVTVNHGSESPSLSDQGRHISFGATEVIESPLSTPTSTPADTPADTPESTLERRKKDGGDATATGDDIQVEVSLAELDEALTNDATAEQEVSVSQVNIASIDQSVPEDPESGEKVRIDSTNQDEDTTEASTDETQANISEQTADDNKAALSPLLLTSNSNNQLDSECGLTKPSQKIQLTTISNDEPTKPVPKPRIVKISQSSDESHPDTSRDRSVSDANRGQGAPVPKPRITRFSSEPQLDTPNKESTDASKKAMTKQKSADQISGRYKKRKAPRRPPPLVLSLDKEDESALSALQSAFLEAFSKQPGSKTATAPVMKLRPSRAPPLPPTFRKDRSSSTNDVKSIKSVQFAPDLKQPGVIQQSKSIDDPQGMSKPVAPVRRKKKTSSDSVSDQHSSPDKVAVESTERLPTPAIRARKSTKKAEVTSDNRVEGKPPVKSVGSQENPNRFEVEVEIVAPPRQAQEDKLCPVALGSTEKTTGQQSTLGQDTCTTKDKGATPTSSKEKPIEVASPAVVQAMPESNPDLSRSLSGELEDTLKSRLMQLHKSMKFEESFDTINSSDDVFLDETFGDPPSEPDAHSSEQLTTSRDSADVQQTDSFNHEEKGEGISFGTNDLKEKELEEEEMVGEMSSGFESECVSTEAVVVESSPNLVIPKHKDTTTDIKEKRAALTKMMKLSLDEDSKETTSYSPTPQGEDSESMLEEKSLTALAGGVTREAVGDQTLQVNKDKTKDTVEESLSLEKEKEEETVEEKEKEKKEGEEKTNVEEKKDVEVHEVTKQQDEIAKAEQPNMEQLAEQYKQLQQQMAMLQQQLVLNPTSASAPMQMNPAMAYQTQQMQQMQQQMILQQQMFMQQQQQAMGGYVMVPQPGGGNVMVPGQPGGGMMMSPPQMMYTPMGVQPLPAYGQVTPPQVVATPAVDQQDSPAKSVADETDSGVKEEPKETSRDQPDEVTHQETPLKPPTDAQATASGRRNVFADILKKKNAPKSSYVLSAQREAQRQRSDSNSSLTSSTSSKEGTAAAALSVETPKLELRTETSPTRHDSPVTNGLSPTSSEPSVSSVEDPPTSPPIATSLSNNFSLNISNNNTSKTMTLNAETSQPEATKDTPTSPPPAAPISSQGSRKVPPAIRPKPQKGPRPFRPASTYGKVSAPENEEGYSSSHVRKVTDLRSMFMLGK